MRKYASLGLVVFVMIGLLAACQSAPDMPDWAVNIPYAEDAIYGVGDAQMSSLSMSRTMAFSRARDEIARQVEVKVKNAITDYAQEAGQGDNKQAIQFAESISRQVAEVTLNGARNVQTYVTDDGRVYAMVEYPLSELKKATESAFQRNENAQFAEFKANEALEALDSELEKGPVE